MNTSHARAAALPLLLAFTGMAQATTYSFQQGLAGYSGAADTQLRASDADAVYGAEPEIGIDASDGGLPTQALLRFDSLFGSGPGQIPLNSVITSATLTLQVTSAGSGLQVHELLVPFNAASITWNSAVNGIQADGSEAAALPLLAAGANDGSTNIGEGPLVLDFTAALQRVQNGSAAGFGWAFLPFMPDGTNGVDFYSADWTTVAERPLLTVEVSPVPEPAAALLLGAGLAALRLRRR